MSSLTRLPFWSLHSHSKYSVNDALPGVEPMVAKAVELGYPALGLTDHGNVSGSIQLYKACRKAGIEPLPGIELYVVPDTEYAGRADNMHLTVAAYNEAGYRNLMHMATLTARRYWYKPRIDFADFAAMAEDGATDGLVVATGCYFGVGPQVLMRRGPAAAVKVVEALAGWFPRVYVELQNHGVENHNVDIDHTDDDVLEGMWHVAQTAGLPVVITRDSHYINPEDKPLHESLKRMVSWSDDVDDAVFPGDGYFMTDRDGLRPFFEPKILEAGIDGLTSLANAAYLRLPEMETFSLKIPDVSVHGDPQEELEELVMAGLKALGRDKDPKYLTPVRKEFDVIRTGGMAPYLLLVHMVCQFMRDKGISFHARGSAAGCLCNYALGITQVDPVRFGLRFDRFLSSNRMKPPDVDLDVEHARRDEVIAFLQSRWAVRSVGSHMKYSLEEEQEGDEGKGSLLVKYYSTARKRGIEAHAWHQIPPADKESLLKLANMKLISGNGTHAAGYIVAPNEESVAELPLAYIASSKKLVTAYGKKDVEQLGFLKLDLLGLRTRTAIRIAQELSGVDFETIPENDRKTFAAIAAGRTIGVFQLDGYAMQRGCQQLKPKKIEDIIAAQALFRPATMNSGATGDYRARRARRDPVPQRHADIMSATAETYGVLLYQEQVMDVMQSLGMTPAELEEMLDAVKASNEYSEGAAKVIEEKMPRIRALATGRGWTGNDIDWLVDGLGAYADYSFNKAHAASYGVIAYRTAYMRTNYPAEFWVGMLVAYADHKKAPGYTMEARRDGVRVLPPHVNHSKANYSMTPDPIDPKKNAIRRGLLAVKGVGAVAAAELESKAPYASLTDLGQRVLPRRVSGAKGLALKKTPAESGGIIAALEDANALERLEP
jgi:DNA polymerase-3 subunit alpha